MMARKVPSGKEAVVGLGQMEQSHAGALQAGARGTAHDHAVLEVIFRGGQEKQNQSRGNVKSTKRTYVAALQIGDKRGTRTWPKTEASGCTRVRCVRTRSRSWASSPTTTSVGCSRMDSNQLIKYHLPLKRETFVEDSDDADILVELEEGRVLREEEEYWKGQLSVLRA